MPTETWWRVAFRHSPQHRAEVSAIRLDALTRLTNGEPVRDIVQQSRLDYALAYDREVDRNPMLQEALRTMNWNKLKAARRWQQRRSNDIP